MVLDSDEDKENDEEYEDEDEDEEEEEEEDEDEEDEDEEESEAKEELQRKKKKNKTTLASKTPSPKKVRFFEKYSENKPDTPATLPKKTSSSRPANIQSPMTRSLASVSAKKEITTTTQLLAQLAQPDHIKLAQKCFSTVKSLTKGNKNGMEKESSKVGASSATASSTSTTTTTATTIPINDRNLNLYDDIPLPSSGIPEIDYSLTIGCDICGEKKPENLLVAIRPCGDTACEECVRKYCTTKFQENRDDMNVRCFGIREGKRCDVYFCQERIKNIVGVKEWQRKYLEYTTARVRDQIVSGDLFANDHVFNCPKCGEFLYIRKSDTTLACSVKCPAVDCDAYICCRCLSKSHKGTCNKATL